MVIYRITNPFTGNNECERQALERKNRIEKEKKEKIKKKRKKERQHKKRPCLTDSPKIDWYQNMGNPATQCSFTLALRYL